MDDLKKYLLTIFGLRDVSNIEKHLIENLEEGSKYNKIQIKDLSILVFKSYDDIKKLKQIVTNSQVPAPIFYICNISKEENFDLNFNKEIEPFILLQEKFFENSENINLKIDDLLDLVIEKGWDNLTKRQKEELKKISKESDE